MIGIITEKLGKDRNNCKRIRKRLKEIKMLWLFQDRMGSNSSEKVGVTNDLKGHAISLGDSCFPYSLSAFHLFNLERRMSGIFQKVKNLFIYQFLYVFRKPFIVPLKRFREGELHFFSALIASDAFENGPMV